MKHFFTQLRNWWVEGGFPLTKLLIALNFLTLTLVTFRVDFVARMSFSTTTAWSEPWSFVTYPLVSSDILWTLFYCFGLYSIGSRIERAWGTKFFGIVFFLVAVIEAASLLLASWLTKTPVVAMTWLPILVLSFSYYMLSPNERVSVFGAFETQMKWLALVDVLIIFFTTAQSSHPVAGLFALSGCALGLWWVRYRAWRDMAMFSYSQPGRAAKTKAPKRNRRDDDFSLRDLNPLEKLARERRRKQFERLMREDEESK